MANNITMTGRLTADPELKVTSSGISVCSFTLAVKRPHTKDVVDFIPCQVWRQGAEYLTKYGAKGYMVAVTGALTTRKWQDKDGNNRISYDVVCDSVELLESRSSGESNNTAPQTAPQPNTQNESMHFEEVDLDEGLPFN
jgi:single-strand DNA-binding protein